jgi:hypothetical protein
MNRTKQQTDATSSECVFIFPATAGSSNDFSSVAVATLH